MPKVGTYFALILLLTFFLSSAARPEPPTLVKRQKESDVEGTEEDADGVNCEGLEKEECVLMRRALAAAHVDYIYSQSHHH